MRVVVADATPLHYLILIDAVDLLPRIFEKIHVPVEVRDELTCEATPSPVRVWMGEGARWRHKIAATTIVAKATAGARRQSEIGVPGEAGLAALAVGGEDEDGGGPVGEDAAVGGGKLGLAGNDLAALGDDASFGADSTGFCGDGAGEIAFGFDGGIAHACGQDGMSSASGGTVEDGERPAAVDGAQRIEQMRAGLALEGGEAIAHFDEAERERFPDGWLGQAAVDDGLQSFPAGHGSDLLWIERGVRWGGHEQATPVIRCSGARDGYKRER